MATTDLVTKKINFTLEKKAEICEILGLSGNPTWDVIKATIASDIEAISKIKKALFITWMPMSWKLIDSLTDISNRLDGEYIYLFKDGLCFFGKGTYSYYRYSVNRWDAKTWIIDGVSSNVKLDGRHFWSDGTNDYYSDGTKQYYYDNGELKTKEWNYSDGVNISNIQGNDIWKDENNNVYYSGGTTHYILNNGVWETVSISLSFTGRCVWHAGGKTFVSPSTSIHYLINSLSDFKKVLVKNSSGTTVEFRSEQIWETNCSTLKTESGTTIINNVSFLSLGNSDNFSEDYYIDGQLTSTSVEGYDYQMTLKHKKWIGEIGTSKERALNSRYFWTDGTNLFCSKTSTSYSGYDGNGVVQLVLDTTLTRTKEWTIAAVQYEVDN